MEDKLEQDIEAAALKSVKNFGEAKDVFHPDYGWILKDGKPTEVGLKWYKDHFEKNK